MRKLPFAAIDRIATRNGNWIHCIATDAGSCTIGIFDADYKRSKFWTVLERSDGTYNLIVRCKWYGANESVFNHDKHSWTFVQAYIAHGLQRIG